MIQRSQRLGCGAKLCCCDYQNRIVSHVSSSVPKRQLPTYLSIDEMIRTRGSQQNSEEALRCQVIAIPDFAEQDWFAAISPIKLTAVSKDVSSNHSNTSGTALSRRSIGPRFKSRNGPAQRKPTKNARAYGSPNWVNGPWLCPQDPTPPFYVPKT